MAIFSLAVKGAVCSKTLISDLAAQIQITNKQHIGFKDVCLTSLLQNTPELLRSWTTNVISTSPVGLEICQRCFKCLISLKFVRWQRNVSVSFCLTLSLMNDFLSSIISHIISYRHTTINCIGNTLFIFNCRFSFAFIWGTQYFLPSSSVYFSLPLPVLDALYVDTSFTKDSAVQNLLQNPYSPSFLNLSFLAY